MKAAKDVKRNRQLQEGMERQKIILFKAVFLDQVFEYRC
jgi:hypothetical protein